MTLKRDKQTEVKLLIPSDALRKLKPGEQLFDYRGAKFILTSDLKTATLRLKEEHRLEKDQKG